MMRPGQHDPAPCFARFTGRGYRYHPADRFWAFQFHETAIYLALAGLRARWVRRRLS